MKSPSEAVLQLPTGMAYPTGIVTFLFTDIVGSTPLWERQPEQMAMAVQQHLAICFAQTAGYLFANRSGFMSPRCLQRRLVGYGKQCDVSVNARRLRHSFASQMLAASMPVTSLQRYMGHEHLDTTMIYAEVSDPMLQQDYYQGITAMDPTSANLLVSHQETFR